VRYSAYPTYKFSGVEWLGDLPEHWKTKAIKWESPVLRGASPRPIDDPKFFDEEGDYAWVRISDVTSAGMYLSETEQKLSTLGSSLSVKLQPGALFLSIAATVGQPAITKIKCCIHDGFVYFPRFKGDPRFLFYVFASGEPYKGLGKLGTQLNLNTDTVGSIIVGFPDVAEQRAIADFLDAETTKLDTLVAKKRELIEKLKEKRSALISRTVTRGLPPEAARAAGLDPRPKLKPSGIEWFGEIPEHWKVRRLKFYLIKMEQGWSPQCDNIAALKDEWGVLKVGAVNGWEFNPMENKRLPEGEEILLEYEIRVGDFLISRANTRELLGSAAVVRILESRLLLCDKLYRLKLSSEALCSDFLLFFIRSIPGHFEFEREATGASDSMQNISQSAVRNLFVPIPPPTEQRAIADYLDRETNKVDRMVEKVEEAIERLQEYRTALITAAVTGKIDVRNVRHSGESLPRT
jgi:type I restriction enzyme S subunit